MRRVCIGMAALAAGLVIACAPVVAETIRFGGILPLTGPGALIGTAEMRGVQFAVDQANAKGGIQGNRIEMLFEDNQARPDQSILSFNKLTDLQHVSVIFTGYSGPTLAMAPVATRKKVLLINAGAQADALAKASPYLINTLPTIGGEIEVISRWAVGDGKKKAGILFENGAAGMAGRDDYLKSFAEAGGTVVAQEILAVRPDRFPSRAAEDRRCQAGCDVGGDHRWTVADGAGIQAARPEVHRCRHDVLCRPFDDRRSVLDRLRAYPVADRRTAGPGGAVQGQVRRRHGVLRQAVLQRGADRACDARQGPGGQKACHRRIHA